jgi:hypothetical protein
MEEHKKKMLIFIGIILIIIAIIAVLLGIIFKDEQDKKTSTEPNGVQDVISKEIEELKDESLFFALQNSINNYYSMLANKNTNSLLDILDDDFKKEKQINNSNIYNIINSDYETVSYIAKSIYYNPNSSISYYFINGYLTNMTMMEDEFQYYPSVNFLIVVDNKSRYFVIKPLESNLNIETFAKSYDIKSKNIKSEILLSSYTISEKNKLIVYITEFINLMVYDNKRAYLMLDDNTRKKYSSNDDFKNQMMDIYNKLSTNIFGFSFKEVNGERIYNIVDDKQNKITIYEKNTMNYRIGY